VVLAAMTDEDPDERPDAVRCGELFRNIASGQTDDIPLPRLAPDLFDPTEPADSDELADLDDPIGPATTETLPAGKPPGKRVRPAHAGLAGIVLAVIALTVVLVTTNNSGAPAGERQRPDVEQSTPRTGVSPPGQTYPAPGPAPVQRPTAANPPPATSEANSDTTTPPTSAPPAGQNPAPGNGTGGGSGGDDNGKHRGKGNGGLLGGILDGLL
jgi:hypothetical protein